MHNFWVAAAVTVLSTTASAETDPLVSAEPAAQTAPAPADFIPAGTLVEIRINEDVNSTTHKIDDWFDISLSQPIVLNGVELVPAGTLGQGQVVHSSSRGGWGSKSGELILAARYLDTTLGRIPLRALNLNAVGKNSIVTVYSAPYSSTIVTAEKAVIKAGRIANAKIAIDLYPGGVAPSEPQPVDSRAIPQQADER